MGLSTGGEPLLDVRDDDIENSRENSGKKKNRDDKKPSKCICQELTKLGEDFLQIQEEIKENIRIPKKFYIPDWKVKNDLKSPDILKEILVPNIKNLFEKNFDDLEWQRNQEYVCVTIKTNGSLFFDMNQSGRDVYFCSSSDSEFERFVAFLLFHQLKEEIFEWLNQKKHLALKNTEHFKNVKKIIEI